MKLGWLVNDRLTCIPGTRTFWHDLLSWVPNLQDRTNGYTPFEYLAWKIENDLADGKVLPEYIIRNATFFRHINFPVKTICLLQDKYPIDEGLHHYQVEVCNKATVTVFNSPYTYSFYKDKIKTRTEIIPLGVDANVFKEESPEIKEQWRKELGIEYNSILYVGSSETHPKGFDRVLNLIETTDFNFVLVMKDNFKHNHIRVKNFNYLPHETLMKVYNACSALICTSREETQHLAGIEAGLCGLPIIATNVGIYYDREEGEWGKVVHDGNFKDAINDVFSRKYSNTRNYWIKEGLTTDTCKEKWIKLINEVCNDI